MIGKTNDYKTVSHRLGHMNEKETIDTYSHLIKDNQIKLINMMDELTNDDEKRTKKYSFLS